MDIKIKNLKTIAAASEETLCFGATVCINGVASFVASNSGKGGCNDYSPYGRVDKDTYPKFRKLLGDVSEWIATLPKVKLSDTLIIKPDLDLIIDDLIEAEGVAKKLKSGLKKKTFFIDTDTSEIFSIKTNNQNPERTRMTISQSHKNAIILNDLPIDDAVSIALKYQGIRTWDAMDNQEESESPSP